MQTGVNFDTIQHCGKRKQKEYLTICEDVLLLDPELLISMLTKRVA